MACDVLVLEDDPLVLLTLAEALRNEGLIVEEARNATEAIRQFGQDGTPRVFVADINLGEKRTGVDVADELHQAVPDLPVIFITGRPDLPVDTLPNARQRLLRKPFSISSLAALIRELQTLN